jgi:hypothetical protein
MEQRLSEMGKESDTELFSENHELAREQNWYAIHQAAAGWSWSTIWAWIVVFMVLLALFFVLFCVCLRYCCAAERKSVKKTEEDQRKYVLPYRQNSSEMLNAPVYSDMLDRHARLRASSLNLLSTTPHATREGAPPPLPDVKRASLSRDRERERRISGHGEGGDNIEEMQAWVGEGQVVGVFAGVDGAACGALNLCHSTDQTKPLA